MSHRQHRRRTQNDGSAALRRYELLGKETDRVTHVLVSEPFEFIRGFYYPGQPGPILEFRPFNGPPAPADPGDAVVELADLPFVPCATSLRNSTNRAAPLPGW
ncbi:CRISPR-associated ring nuclease Csm6 [Verrucomicrobium spinosum]|uniref:CRISPR-associated ring nuclease Csm6 n=1 Tax=Verrucomicrobium spinosum TaxID=2736 RepID=UPI003CCD7827